MNRSPCEWCSPPGVKLGVVCCIILQTVVRCFTKYGLLGLVGACVAFFTGCIAHDFGNAVVTAAVSQAITLPLELSL